MELLLKRHSKSSSGEDALKNQEEESNKKAKTLYDVLDKYEKVYRVVPEKRVRSRMNICFRIPGGDEAEFLKGAEGKGLFGLKGHRSVGGIRISSCMFSHNNTQFFYDLLSIWYLLANTMGLYR